jgi:uncharacterized protein YrrD
MTLRSLKDVQGAAIRATDGEIGSVHELLFDDQHWTARYLVADTGGWLTGRLVLLSPAVLGDLDWQERTLDVRLTRRQIEESPDITTDQPVSRQHELDLANYYGYGPYWGGVGLWGPAMYPVGLWRAGTVSAPVGAATDEPSRATQEERGDPHLRSTREVAGYAIAARDDEIGHVADFILDDESWAVRYLVVDTRNWWPGKHVLVAPQWITGISWPDRAVMVGLTRAEVKGGPEYDPSRVLGREDEARLYRHYGRAGYWEDDRQARR